MTDSSHGGALASAASDQDVMEPDGGQPPLGTQPSVADLWGQVAYQRAFEAVVWSQPAVAIYGIRRGQFRCLGMKDNDVMAMSGTLTSKHEFITANNTTAYVTSNADLRAGPVVVEVPAAGDDGVMYGQVVDAWQNSFADVGPSGADAGKGGKYLFLPPGFDGDIPDGYIAVRSTTYRIAFAFRSIALPGMTREDTNAYARKLRIHPLSQAEDPPATRFVDGIDQRISTLPYYDHRYFQDVYEIVSVEPVRERDKVMMGMLATLGIEPGKLFEPSEAMVKVLDRAAADAYFYLQELVQRTQMTNLYWPTRYWSYYFYPDSAGGFAFDEPTALDYDSRAVMYHSGTYFPQRLPDRPATVYLSAMADSEGRPLAGGATYRLRVPKGMPVKQFWALIVYDYATWAFIYNEQDRVGLSSYDLTSLFINDDGSVDLYIGPAAPAGLESNWIPTSGKRPFPVMRLYAPDEPFWDKTFVLPDLELLEPTD
jgi:hypothetical protein